MSDDAASLQNLHDIVVPPSAPWWPPAPGWYLLLVTGLLLLAAVLLKYLAKRRRNAYRRAALAELRANAEQPESLLQIATLLKRTALAAYPREQVASLTGDVWVGWLSQSSGLAVPPSVRETLTQGLYREATRQHVDTLVSFVEQWIRCHRGGDSC